MKTIILRGKSLKLTIAISILIIALALFITIFHPQGRAVSGGERLVPIYGVETAKQQVAISFDASWGAEFTTTILDTLDEYNVKATFFLVNIWLEDYPEMAKEIASRGHELGLHSTTHPHCTQLSEDQLIAELADNYQMIYDITGCKPTLFRPPFGDYNNQVISTVQSQGYECIQWSVDA